MASDRRHPAPAATDTETHRPTMARTNTPTRKKLDLATAEQADGALPSTLSVYQMAGIRDNKYVQGSFAGFRQHIRGMELGELQDYAYELGVAPSASANSMFERLEEKYLRDNPEQRDAYQAERARAAKRGQSADDQVEALLARGR